MRRTIDISGMGGGYENACQLMMERGLAWLREHPDAHLTYKAYEHVYGIASAETSAAKELDKAITAGVDCTGAMHQAVVSHLLWIHAHGYDDWLDEAERRKQGHRLYTWDGTPESCPVTKLSVKK